MPLDPKLQRALDQFTLSARTYKGQRDREVDYLRFQVPEEQWDKRTRDYRTAQFGNDGVPMPPDPTLSISMIDEPLALVENQFRAANLEPHIHPLTEDASSDTAQVLEELNRHIDVDPESRMETARGWAFARALRAGLGWYVIDKVFDPSGGHPFDQKIIGKRILDQASVFPDPTAQQPDWSDGMFLHELVDIPWQDYKRRYKDSKLANYSDGDFKALGPDQMEWVQYVKGDATAPLPQADRRVIRVSNYSRVEIESVKHVLLNDGSVAPEDEIPEGLRVATQDDLDAMQYDGITERLVETRRVFRSVMNGVEELEPETEWDGQYIPYIPVIGIELQPFNGERRWVGMIAGAMDAQRLVNYSASQAVKLAALEPQANWLGEEGIFENHELEFAQSNNRKFPFLQYKPTNSAGMRSTPPIRAQVDVSRLGPSMELLTMGKDFVQRAMFTFGPGLGEQTPAHRSGTAIQALQGQSMHGNSHYLDNVATISLPLEMKIKLDLMPHVYDRPGRVVQVITGEGASRPVMLNQAFVLHPQTKQPLAAIQQPANLPLPDGMQLFDLNKGRYGVSVTVGKSNDSRLQEGSDAIGRLLEADPQLLPVLGPAWAGFQDFPGAHAVKQALVKWQQHVAPFMVDSQTPAAQVQQLQQQLQQLTQAATKMKQDLDTDAQKYQAQALIEKHKADVQLEIKRMDDATKIEVARITAAKEGIIADREAAEERLATGLKILADAENARLDRGHEATQAELDRQHEVRATGLEHGAAVAASAQEHQQAVAQAEQGNQHALEQADAQRQIAEAQPSSDASEPSGA